MNDQLRNIFLEEIKTHCEMTILRVSDANSFMQKIDNIAATEFRERITIIKKFFFSLSTFVGHAAMVSKILWPSNPSSYDRGLFLRQFLELPEDHIISEKKLRNHLEHYDERLDRWFAQSPQHNYATDNLGSLTSIQGIAKTDIFRHYDPRERIFWFWGESYNMQEYVNGLIQIQNVVRNKVNSYENR